MSHVHPIAGNDGYKRVENTFVNGSEVNNALHHVGLTPLKVVKGTLSPLGAGNYAVVGANGTTVTLPPNALVANVFLRGPSLLGGTNAQPVLSATNGGGAGTALSAAVVLADLQAGAAPAVTSLVGVSNVWLSVTTTGTFTSGALEVAVLYY